jgi:hypothetical protein
MWRSKKFIIGIALAVVALVGSIGGVALADDNEADSTHQSQQAALLERICEIYEANTGTAIDAEALQNACDQAQSEMWEEALQNQIQSLVDEGKLTQEQADEYLKWWESRPEDLPFGLGLMPHDGGLFGDFGRHGGGFPGGGELPATSEE